MARPRALGLLAGIVTGRQAGRRSQQQPRAMGGLSALQSPSKQMAHASTSMRLRPILDESTCKCTRKKISHLCGAAPTPTSAASFLFLPAQRIPSAPAKNRRLPPHLCSAEPRPPAHSDIAPRTARRATRLNLLADSAPLGGHCDRRRSDALLLLRCQKRRLYLYQPPATPETTPTFFFHRNYTTTHISRERKFLTVLLKRRILSSCLKGLKTPPPS